MAASEPDPARTRPVSNEPDPVSDEELLARVAAGDESAFTVLYERYFRRVYPFVKRRLGSREDTEETVQEVFINVFSSVHTYQGKAPVAAWILGVARRVVANRFKKKRHTTVPLDLTEESGTSPQGSLFQREASPLENYECRERIARLDEGLRNDLTEKQRSLFLRHHLEEQPITSLASAGGASTDSVKSNLYRTRKLLLAR